MSRKSDTKTDTKTDFKADDMGYLSGGLFGLPIAPTEAKLHLIPVPWEVTTSYGRGASRGPAAILRASRQIDLFDLETGNAWKSGFHMDAIDREWVDQNRQLKEMALERLELLESGEDDSTSSIRMVTAINEASAELNRWVEQQALEKLRAGKLVGVIGGDHSTPFGLIKALHDHRKADFGILHIDAHADLRSAYQGYTDSHASIMFNVMERLKLPKLVQVGIRDFSEAEFDYARGRKETISTFYDRTLKRRLENGESWKSIAAAIVEELPAKVYVSFDIDGLEPSLCPHTGTPVPGGLSFDHACSLLAAIADAGKSIVGFDLNEVAEPEEGEAEWDANVGARLLYKLCGWTAVTNGAADRGARV